MKAAKIAIKHILKFLGYEVLPIRSHGGDPFADMAKFVDRQANLTIFDVGANEGQTVRNFKKTFPQANIYSFEPSAKTFEILKRNVGNETNVCLHNVAFGSLMETKTFYENTHSDMSSFLSLGKAGWGAVTQESCMQVVTIDSFCHEKDIKQIHILKSDTQGYEIEVLKGAIEMMKNNSIQLIYLEILFSDLYEGLQPFHDLAKLLSESNYRLVSFYQFHYQEDMASWADALFVNMRFKGG